MKLSTRLETVASFVKKGSRVADIGTDHGYVPIYLIEEGIAEAALAMDVRKGPLERAVSHIRQHGLETQIQCRQSDGLAELRPGEADTVVIAGMGGELVIHILEEGKHVWDTVNHWILSPQSELSKVRSYLEENDFVTLDETMLTDEGKYYTVISAARNLAAGDEAGRKSKEAEQARREAYDRYGRLLIEKRDPVLRAYLEKEKDMMTKILDQLGNRNSDHSRQRREELAKEIALIEEVQNEMR